MNNILIEANCDIRRCNAGSLGYNYEVRWIVV